jgi:hypothetical protein
LGRIPENRIPKPLYQYTNMRKGRRCQGRSTKIWMEQLLVTRTGLRLAEFEDVSWKDLPQNRVQRRTLVLVVGNQRTKLIN